MPLYEYECTKCHKRTEKIERAAGPHLKKCPHCGRPVERVLTAPAIQFKGSGWYVTDYAAKKAAGGESSTATAEGTAKEAGKEAAKESPAKDTKEKKTKK